ncbi:MAG TPA: molybdopterin-dependent oxidoreductase [Planctomycetota bacterium]|nr:molybdopterin-dependent oxidoreductase [Planctomycetota bacterium]
MTQVPSSPTGGENKSTGGENKPARGDNKSAAAPLPGVNSAPPTNPEAALTPSSAAASVAATKAVAPAAPVAPAPAAAAKPAGAPAAGGPPAPGGAPAPAGPPPPPAIVLPKAPPGKVALRVNGKDYFVKDTHRNLIDALSECGLDVPHFCYHEGLKPAGNCRMCYVAQIDTKTGKPMMGLNLATFTPSVRLMTSCTTPLDKKNGMVIETESEAVKDGRKLIMEFLLANHPLDCPVCDKAGECDLQDYSVAHGRDRSRMVEEKNVSDVRALGPSLMIWQTRCIVCTRCVRFLDEVTGTGELCVTQRGDHSQIETFPGKVVDNPMMGNLTDVCPVGAIIDKDFMFQARVWWLEKNPTVSPVNSLGENILLEHIQGDVKRIRPVVNLDVNGHWISDETRYDYRYINSPERLTDAKIGGKVAPAGQALDNAVKILRDQIGRTAVIGSLWATVEEMVLLKKLAEALGNAPIALLEKPPVADIKLPGYTIPGDKNPNRAGAKLVFGGDKPLQPVLDQINAGKIKCLAVFNAIPQGPRELLTVPFTLPPALVVAADKLEDLVLADFLQGPLAAKAKVLLATACYAEKDGVFVNSRDRVQKTTRAVEPPGRAIEEVILLQRLINGLQSQTRMLSAAQIFKEVADSLPALANMTHWKLRKGGMPLVTAAAAAPAAGASAAPTK